MSRNQSVTFRFCNFSIFLVVSASVSKKTKLSQKIWFWFKKKTYRIQYVKQIGVKKSFEFSFVQILGILGEVSVLKLLGLKKNQFLASSVFQFLAWY